MTALDNIDVADDGGSWFIYKWDNGKLDVVFIHWSTAQQFEDKRILSRPFPDYDEARDFLEEFQNVWWKMSFS